MIAQLLRYALNQRFITILLALTLIGLGYWSFLQLKVEAYPDISDTQVVVITTYPGRAAEEVEQLVTIPLERALNSVPNVIARRSRTIFGLSVVELTFSFGTNDYFARQVVLEKLDDAELPDGVNPSLGPLSTPIGELYRYELTGDGFDARQLREIQDWVITPRILQVPGIADVTPFGGLVKQYQIQVDPLALSKYSLTIDDVKDAVAKNNENAGGALLDNGQQSMVIRGVGRVESIFDIENVIITAVRGIPILVKDIGKVVLGSAPQTGIFALNDNVGGVEGIVLMRRGENPSDVLSEVQKVINELNQEELPQGVRISPFYDRIDLVNNTLETVTHTLLEGLTIVLVVLMFLLGSARAALLTAITIPLSLLFAFTCMHFSGIPANLLSLGAIDFGIIVDASLVMVEHILHRIHEDQGTENTILDSIRSAALEVERPIFFSLMIIISAYIPLFTLERVERKLFTPMAFTVSYALLGSLLLALTIVPVLATYLFRNGAKSWENPLFRILQKRYEKVLRFSIRRPKIILSASSAIVAGAFALSASLGVEFLPVLDEGVIWIRMVLPPGTSIEKSSEIATEARKIIRSFPEVTNVSSQSGRNDSGTDPYGPNRIELFVGLQPYNTWPDGMTKASLINHLSKQLDHEIPGAVFSFTQPIIDTVTESVTGSSADLAVIISGPDLAKLRTSAQQVLEMIRKIPGAADSAIEQEADQAQLRILVNRNEIARYGINIHTVQDVIELAIGGDSAGYIFEGERRFDITVRYVPEARSDISAIGRILVPSGTGSNIPLSQLAEIKVVNGASIIARRDNKRQITVRTNIRGRDQGSFVEEAQKHFRQQIKLPDGYSVNWGGQFENLSRAAKRLKIIMPITIAIIFVLLFFMFGNATYAGIVMMNVPFALVGGILFLWIRNINLSVSAAVGFISLFGVAVMSGVLVVAEINRRRRIDPDIEPSAAIVQGSLSQLRPVLLMVLVALLGMVPAARATGIGSDVQRPLATVVVGGLISTLLLTLVALPCLYAVFAEKPGKKDA